MELLKKKENIFIVLLFIIVATFLFARTLGLYPFVFSDEYSYSKFSRNMSFSEAYLPNYLYFFIYKYTSMCGSGFLDCARLINVIFFSASMPVIYMIGSKVSDKRNAVFIAFISIMGPVSTYTAFFMPESLYFFCFWITVYLLLKIDINSHFKVWVPLSIVFGLTSLVKPHALFFLPSIAMYVIAISLISAKKIEFLFLCKYCGFVFLSLCVKFFLGYFLAGVNGITFFGSLYSGIAAQTSFQIADFINLVYLFFNNIFGHILGIALLFSVCVVSLPNYFLDRLQKNNSCDYSLKLVVITFCTFMVLIPITALFTARISVDGVYESTSKLHMRYYNFAFPLLYLIALLNFEFSLDRNKIRTRLFMVLPVLCLVIYGMFSNMAGYTHSLVDSPELHGYTGRRNIF